jgi:hypothetical protein
MKTYLKISGSILAMTMMVMGCEDLEKVTPAPSASASNLTANFLMINASPDAPSLDFYVNNVKAGASVTSGLGQAAYNTVSVTTNSVGANTNIRAKATSGTIGGVLKSSDLIYRAGNNNSNDFVAAAGGSYTLIVVDSLNRPVPTRTLNASNFGDVTYYSSKSTFTGKQKSDGVTDTVINLNVGSNNSIVTANLLKKYNNNALPSFFVPIGVVPLGSSDVGGIRFLLLTDNLPLPATSPLFPVPVSGKFAARFINAVPDGASATCKINGATVGGLTTFPMTQANFNPSVGSQAYLTSKGSLFTNNVTAAGTYDIVVTMGAGTYKLTSETFADGGIYTVVLTGQVAKGNVAVTLVKNN